MKKLISLLLVVAMLVGACCLTTGCKKKNEEIIVQTNAYFAPFEYYVGTEIKGVDVDIMNKVGKKLDKKVTFKNVDFGVIIDNVSAGKVCDVGAAGLTITDERKEKVDFSIPYYTSVQYVIYAEGSDIATKTGADGDYIVWEALKGKTIGTQTDTTGWIYVNGEITGEDFDGLLKDSGAELKNFDNAQLAADAIGGKKVDVVVIDELPAQYIVAKNSGLKCLPLYYAGETDAEDAPVEEQYAICVTKGNDDLLDAINDVLKEMLKEDENGESEIEKLVMKHMGLDK